MSASTGTGLTSERARGLAAKIKFTSQSNRLDPSVLVPNILKAVGDAMGCSEDQAVDICVCVGVQAAIFGFSKREGNLRNFKFPAPYTDASLSWIEGEYVSMPEQLYQLFGRREDRNLTPDAVTFGRMLFCLAPTTQQTIKDNKDITPILTRNLGIDRLFAFVGVAGVLNNSRLLESGFLMYTKTLSINDSQWLTCVKLGRTCIAAGALTPTRLKEVIQESNIGQPDQHKLYIDIMANRSQIPEAEPASSDDERDEDDEDDSPGDDDGGGGGSEARRGSSSGGARRGDGKRSGGGGGKSTQKPGFSGFGLSGSQYSGFTQFPAQIGFSPPLSYVQSYDQQRMPPPFSGYEQSTDDLRGNVAQRGYTSSSSGSRKPSETKIPRLSDGRRVTPRSSSDESIQDRRRKKSGHGDKKGKGGKSVRQTEHDKRRSGERFQSVAADIIMEDDRQEGSDSTLREQASPNQ